MYASTPDMSTVTTLDIPPDLLAARLTRRIADSSNENAKSVVIRVVAETGSTNTDLLAEIEALTNPVLLVALSQTAGRGRAGRAWRTTATSALTFSLAWHFKHPIQALSGLPLAVGVMLAEALQVFGVAVTLKWPNDILRDGAKLAGILIETTPAKRRSKATDIGTEDEAGTWVVIGIGLNLDLSAHLHDQIGRAAADVPELKLHGRERLLAIILSALVDGLIQFDQNGFRAFTHRWNDLHAWHGRRVRVLDGERTVHEGIAVAVDSNGRLLIDGTRGRVAVATGDVSLRLQDQDDVAIG